MVGDCVSAYHNKIQLRLHNISSILDGGFPSMPSNLFSITPFCRLLNWKNPCSELKVLLSYFVKCQSFPIKLLSYCCFEIFLVVWHSYFTLQSLFEFSLFYLHDSTEQPRTFNLNPSFSLTRINSIGFALLINQDILFLSYNFWRVFYLKNISK